MTHNVGYWRWRRPTGHIPCTVHVCTYYIYFFTCCMFTAKQCPMTSGHFPCCIPYGTPKTSKGKSFRDKTTQDKTSQIQNVPNTKRHKPYSKTSKASKRTIYNTSQIQNDTVTKLQKTSPDTIRHKPQNVSIIKCAQLQHVPSHAIGCQIHWTMRPYLLVIMIQYVHSLWRFSTFYKFILMCMI
jgi:hypothetical protein